MSATLISDLSEQVQKFWAPTWKSELMETNILMNQVDKEYEGEIKQAGDSVYITQVTRPTGAIKTVGAGHEFFSTEKLGSSRIQLKADRVFSAAYEFDSLLQLQTDLAKNDSVIRQNLMQAMSIQVNNYLYSFVDPTAATGSVTDFNASQMAALRKFAGQKKWMQNKPWYCNTDSSYYSDLLSAATLTSVDYGAADAPVIGGNIGLKRYGFNIFEDNSDGLLSTIANVSGTDTVDVALAFHPDWLHFGMQLQPEFEISSLHSNKQFGYVISVRAVGGAVLGHDYASLHQVVFNT
jgi:hypothetical protein